MIIIFPMIADENVSQNALPGVCKALEKFIIIYEMDAIMKSIGAKVIKIGGSLASNAAGRLLAKTESENLLEDMPKDMSERPLTKKEKEDSEIAKARFGMDVERYETEKRRSTVKNVFDTLHGIQNLGKVSVDMPTDQALSVEPTYTIVTTTLGTKLVGIKVIPIPIKSQYSLADLLTVDASMKFFDTIGLKIQRKVIRLFWTLCRGLRLPFLSDRVISGDPEKDILWASSYHKRNVFCLLNYADITDNQFFKNAGGIRKLHKLGWNSFIAMDDINKRAIFCMKQFHGLCSVVPYNYIYSSMGKEHDKVYDKLEDIKKSASPFFKTSLSMKKIIGESKQLLSNYLKRIS